MKSPRLLAVVALCAAAAITLWLVGFRPDDLRQDPANPSLAASSVSDGPTSTPVSEPGEVTRTLAGDAGSGQEALAQAGYYDPLTTAADEAVLRERTPLAQILTPTSGRDAEWMARALYPRCADIESPDVEKFERIVREGHPIRDRDAMAYAANVLAAHYYAQDDDRWREFANQSFGSFPAMLHLADAKRRLEAGVADGNEIARLIARAQVLGEPDAIALFERTGVTLPRIDGFYFAGALRSEVRTLERLNRDAIRRGETPFHPVPRPAAPWDGGP